MATFQKKTSDLLKEQKASYPKMVKSALKGKTGLTRAQVKKTIKGVAKDYREQYGATPRERYLKALAKVSAEGLEPIAAKSVKLKNAKTKAKAAIKSKTTSTPLPKSEAQRYAEEVARKSVERIRRRNERIRQRTEAAVANHKAEQAKTEAEQKAADKSKYLTINETFIKQFATDLGLSTATIKAMYKVAADYRKEGKLRPVMCGLYCDPDGYLVATDAHLLFAIKCKIPAKYKNNLYLSSGQTQEGKYPNYKVVMPLNSGIPNNDYVCTDLFTACLDVKGKKTIDHKEKEYTLIKTADNKTIGLVIELLKKADKVFKTLKERNIKVWTKSPSHSVLFLGDNVAAIQMPFLFSGE